MSRCDPRALLLVILTLVALVALREAMGLRELKGVERPVRFYRLPGAGA